MATGLISRCRRLVVADLARENAEVLRESEGEEASPATEEEVFALSLAQPHKQSHRRKKLSPSKEDPWPPDRSLGTAVSLQQILPEKTHKCFGIVKQKKPPPPRKRKCLVWRLVREISCSTLFRISTGSSLALLV
ncbi:uncharacterized protein G2W53_017788 [Senna tora]|uniref:Uncharacterized protein n=1 Tax=Senna tora TaxID=362788 RepID=A0A834WR38_9FABA|nr:uncharacterized protein G2W53_017788 [Senna tora]